MEVKTIVAFMCFMCYFSVSFDETLVDVNKKTLKARIILYKIKKIC